MTTFNVLLAVASLLAGAIAAVTGFGIGSLLTPVLALKVGTKLAHDCRSPSFDPIVAVVLLLLGIYMVVSGGG